MGIEIDPLHILLMHFPSWNLKSVVAGKNDSSKVARVGGKHERSWPGACEQATFVPSAPHCRVTHVWLTGKLSQEGSYALKFQQVKCTTTIHPRWRDG